MVLFCQDGLAKIVGDRDPEFWSENKNPYFTLPNGLLTCYGDEVATTLQVLADNKNGFEVEKLLKVIEKKFGSPGGIFCTQKFFVR